MMQKVIEVIASFKNEDEGVESIVTIGDRGYHVSLRDTDADMIVGITLIFKDKDTAIAKAKEII